ncbi:MAG: hypothetical protein ACXWTE_01825 [Methylobacter sp.]
MKKKKLIVFLYNRLFDALIQSNFWLYILDYLEDDNNQLDIVVITYEDGRYPLSNEQRLKLSEWEAKGMIWEALQWHPGTGLLNKALDILSGFGMALKYWFNGYHHMVTLASVAGSYGYLYSIVLRFKLYLYQFEPHSEYALDNGMWGEASLQFKISHFLEREAAYYAKVIASGTVFMQQRLENEWQVRAKFFKIPTVANDKKFLFSEHDRINVREKLGIPADAWVLFYPGKFGSLYYREQTPLMFKWLWQQDSRLHFLIVTPQPRDEVQALFDQADVDRSSYTITHSDYEEIHQYFSAADFAVIAVPPGPSKKFISNIKVGEYLCAGLPYLITKGVSEDYLYADNSNVGVVVDDFVEDEIKAAWPKIKAYLEQDPIKRRTHCRSVGLDYRGFAGRNLTFKAAITALFAKD